MQFDSGTNVEFMNEYVQIISRNLDSIIKNNFLLEAKYVILEKSLAEKLNVEQINQQLIQEKNELENKINQIQTDSNFARDQYVQDILGEKNRIQEAFNTEMREHASLRSSFDSVQAQLSQLQNEKNQHVSTIQNLENEKNQLINSINLLQNQIAEKENEKLSLLETNKNLQEKINNLNKPETAVKSLNIDKTAIKKDKKKITPINKIEVKSGGTF